MRALTCCNSSGTMERRPPPLTHDFECNYCSPVQIFDVPMLLLGRRVTVGPAAARRLLRHPPALTSPTNPLSQLKRLSLRHTLPPLSTSRHVRLILRLRRPPRRRLPRCLHVHTPAKSHTLQRQALRSLHVFFCSRRARSRCSFRACALLFHRHHAALRRGSRAGAAAHRRHARAHVPVQGRGVAGGDNPLHRASSAAPQIIRCPSLLSAPPPLISGSRICRVLVLVQARRVAVFAPHVSRHSLPRASDRVQLVSVRRPSLPSSSPMPRSLAHCTPWSAVDSRGVAPWVAPPVITSIADASRYFHQLHQLNAITSLGPFVNRIISPLMDDRSFIFCVV
jgi:hypothetical protein